MFELNKRFGAVNVNVKFKNRINILSGSSGSGKTLLFSYIKSYCLHEKMSYRRFDSSLLPMASTDIREIILKFKGSDVICLDNADLYLNNDLYNDFIRSCSDSIIFIALHCTAKLRSDFKDAGIYTLTFQDNNLFLGG